MRLVGNLARGLYLVRRSKNLLLTRFGTPPNTGHENLTQTYIVRAGFSGRWTAETLNWQP